MDTSRLAGEPASVNDQRHELNHAPVARARRASSLLHKQCDGGACPCERWFTPRVRTQRYFNQTCKNRAAQQRYRAFLRERAEKEENR